MRFDAYQTQGFRDEMFDDAGVVRPEARLLLDTIESLEEGQLLQCQQAAERLLLQMGITFNVYGDSAGAERIFPFDLIPRIVRAEEWAWIERGLKQRIHALNEFIDDIYHDQKILQDKIIPQEVIYSATFYRPQCAGINPPRRIWCHITGTRGRFASACIAPTNLCMRSRAALSDLSCTAPNRVMGLLRAELDFTPVERILAGRRK